MSLKLQKLLQFFRKMIPMTKPAVDKLVSSHLFLKYTKRYFMNKLKNLQKDPTTQTVLLEKAGRLRMHF